MKRIVGLSAAAALHAFWLVVVAATWNTPELLRRDYRIFWEAGRSLWQGHAENIYGPRPGAFPFLHPPCVITLALPLGMLEPRHAYVAIVVFSFLLLALSALALRRIVRSDHSEAGTPPDLVWLGALASAPWGIALILGQPASLLLAAWLLALWAWERKRDLVAGLAWSILLVKPHFAIAALAFVLAQRRLRAVGGMGIGAVACFLLSLPSGLARWPEWIASIARASSDVANARVPLWKQHTLFAFVRSIVPDATIAWIVWALIAIPLGALTVWMLRRPAITLRAGSLLVLATIALAPYAYFYDALLLVVPAASLWLEAPSYPRRLHRMTAGLAAITFAWQHVGFFVLQRGPSIGGLLAALWLALELFSTHHRIRELDRQADPQALELGREVGR